MRILISAAIAAALIVPGVVAHAGEPAPAFGDSARTPVARSVTLITGDRVELRSRDGSQYTVVPGPGRKKIPFSSRFFQGRLTVVPADAMRGLADGTLDRRLFDVTELVESRYDDAHAKQLPLLVTYEPGRASRADVAGVRPVRQLSAVDGVAVRPRKADATSFWKRLRTEDASIKKVWLDGIRKPRLDQSVPRIGAPTAWKAGLTGTGVTVAVLDTGVDAAHPDLAGQVVEAKNFTEEGPADLVGHGTHVASTIAGTGKASGGKYKGVAPDAKLLDGKVCEEYGCPESAILAGMQWAAETKRAKVVNLSLGGSDTAEVDPLEQAVNELTARTGTLFVIAAGNDGPGAGSVGSPGSAEAALTVGAVDKKDVLADFSSRGPRVGDSGLKPDLVAPGVDIVAAKFGTQEYWAMSGTSMATPHVVGAAAILAQQHPSWAAARLKSTLMGTTKALDGLTAFEQGTGRVDVSRAIAQQVVAEPASLSFGMQRWPHADDKVLTRTVTYRNDSASAVNLALTATVTGPDGKPGPAGMLTLSAATVTVPAKGSARVQVSIDTRKGGPDGMYAGVVTATGSGVTSRTNLSVLKEIESYDVTVKHLDRSGKPTLNYGDLIADPARVELYEPWKESDTYTIRLPKGKHLLESVVLDGETLSTVLHPVFEVDGNRTVVIDARQAKPVDLRLFRTDARQAYVHATWSRWFRPDLPLQRGIGDYIGGGIFTAQVGPALPANELESRFGAVWADPGSDGEFTEPRFVYQVEYPIAGRLTTGFQRVVGAAEFARIRSSYVSPRSGMWADHVAFVSTPMTSGGSTVGFPFRTPWQLDWYVNTEPRVKWGAHSLQFDRDAEGYETFRVFHSDARPIRYEAGRKYHVRWGEAALGAALPDWRPDGRSYPWVGRQGDLLFGWVPPFSDGAGHTGEPHNLDAASTKLYRDGTLVASADQSAFLEGTVPASRSVYRLEYAATRGRDAADVSTQVDASFTFPSARTPDDTYTPMPLWTVRFTPSVDERNAVRRKPLITVPVRVEPMPGAKVGRLRSVRVEVSYDDGKTWRRVPLLPSGQAVLRPPSTAEAVSLRATAADSAGSSVNVSIVRAFLLR